MIWVKSIIVGIFVDCGCQVAGLGGAAAWFFGAAAFVALWSVCELIGKESG